MIGQTVSHYKITAKLGSGGMGDVYLAQDTRLGRKVALKFLLPELARDREAVVRFRNEAKAAAELSHPNIATIYDFDEADGQPFLVFEYLEGCTLKDRISEGPLSIDEVLRIGQALAEGLVEAHGHGIVHRDIKSANVMLTPQGGVKILDFGLAHRPDATQLTRPGTALGTVSYMSPEQAKGETADERSDIWSLGVVLYECLVGKVPFAGESAEAVIHGVLGEEPVAPTGLRTGVPLELERVVDKSLTKDRRERYQTTADLLADLRRLARETSQDKPMALRPETGPLAGRWLGLVAVIVVAGLVMWRGPWTSRETPVMVETDQQPEAPGRPNWILVSEFSGPKDDPELAPAVRELVISSLMQSDFVTPLSRSDLKHGLALAMKPDSTRVEGEVARELAYRAAARVYVEGRVDRIVSGYSIVLSVLDAETGSFVFSVQGTAATGDDVIATLDRTTRDLREQLGENRERVAATRPSQEVMTPSFAAYQEWIRGTQFHDEYDYLSAREKAREALRFDPDFVNAWTLLAWSFLAEDQEDSARYAYEEALSRPARQTEQQFLATKAMVTGFLEYRFTEALELYDRLIHVSPGYYINRAVVLALMGRMEEALESDMKGMEMAPFGPTSMNRINTMVRLTRLGRYDEARQIIPKLRDARDREDWEISLALALSDWAQADSIMTEGIQGSQSPIAREMARASLEASRGSLRTAVSRRASETARRFGLDDKYHFCFWKVHLLKIAGMDGLLSTFPACSDTTVSGLIVQGVWKASIGDTQAAMSILGAIRRKPERLQRKYRSDIIVAEAWIDAANGEWEKVTQALAPLTQQGQHPFVTNRLPIRWLVSEAYEKQGLLEQSAEAFELVISPLRINPRDLYVRASYVSLAHYRLVLLYSQLGRLDEARQHLLAFQEMFTDPDSELAFMIEEARSAVASLENDSHGN